MDRSAAYLPAWPFKRFASPGPWKNYVEPNLCRFWTLYSAEMNLPQVEQ